MAHVSSPSANPSAARSNARGFIQPNSGPAAGSAGRTGAAPAFAGLTGPALIRLLAQIGACPVPSSPAPSFAARLSHWLTWTDAIALSSALEPGAAAVPAYQPPPADAPLRPAGASPEEKEAERVRAALARSIARDEALTADQAFAPLPRRPRDAPPDGDKPVPLEFAPYRQAYLGRQQSVQAAIGALRGRMRSALALESPGLARLAAIDAVMEQVLAPREHLLLATVPTLLERHFRRLRDAAAGAGPWLDTFCQDMRAVLLAELELRFQPVDGLLQAQRERSHPDTRP